MSDDVRRMARELHAHLAATGERPLSAEANRWLGEAEAAAADAVGEEVPLPVIEKRAGQVRELLAHVEATGDEEADDHVDAARAVASEIDERLE